ncbi:MAG: DUF4942 domain-containing protein [Desulfobacterales bacterium]
MYRVTVLIPHQSVVALVVTYYQAKQEITKAKQRLKKAGNIDRVLQPDARSFDLSAECKVTESNQPITDKQRHRENEYFSFYWYKKGSLPIRFKRMDMIQRLNKLAGGNRLKNT